MKMFARVWGCGYNPDTDIVEEGSVELSTDNGYTEEDLAAIAALDVSETWRAPTPEFHVVIRLE